jgi:DNA-directed RNA polymerase subunit RPC12/RpoP
MRDRLTRLSCALWGHHVDNHVFKQATGHDRRCRCGSEYLGEDRSLTRVRHTLSCFLGKHDYEKLADRDGWHEYVCTQCGHPLLFDAEHDPYSATTTFKKKVRYLCGLVGHRVRHVTARDGFEEYACFCGHSFLKAIAEPKGSSLQGRVEKIRHPAICVVSGHFIRFLTRRGGYAEYVCVNCGHPFCFAEGRRSSGPDLYSRHEAGSFGHIHRAQIRQPVPAVVGAADRVGQQHHAGVRGRLGWRRHQDDRSAPGDQRRRA